jgi:hypothetical protein
MLIDCCMPTCTCTHVKLSKTSFFLDKFWILKRHSSWDVVLRQGGHQTPNDMLERLVLGSRIQCARCTPRVLCAPLRIALRSGSYVPREGQRHHREGSCSTGTAAESWGWQRQANRTAAAGRGCTRRVGCARRAPYFFPVVDGGRLLRSTLLGLLQHCPSLEVLDANGCYTDAPIEFPMMRRLRACGWSHRGPGRATEPHIC